MTHKFAARMSIAMQPGASGGPGRFIFFPLRQACEISLIGAISPLPRIASAFPPPAVWTLENDSLLVAISGRHSPRLQSGPGGCSPWRARSDVPQSSRFDLETGGFSQLGLSGVEREEIGGSERESEADMKEVE